MGWTTKDLMNQRTEFAMKAVATENFRQLCREYGISPRVGYKWKRRFLAEGLSGMHEKSRRPKRSPGGLSEEEVCRVVALRHRHEHWGARKLQVVYERQWGEKLSESSIKRVLKKTGLMKKKAVRPARASGRLSSGRRAQAPNEVWTVDFKGWWYDGQGRCEPLTVRDEYSRYVLEARALANAKTETVRAVFERLFERYGLPQAMRSDNGAPFASTQGLLGLSRLSVWWLALGIELERSRPGCPQDNGAHERMHRDLCAEVEGTVYEQRQAVLETWRQSFNEERPHEALGMQCPGQVYRRSERLWTGTPEQLAYEAMASRQVQSSGIIHYEGQRYAISAALGGWNVGLKPKSTAQVEVYFGRLLLGHLELRSAHFQALTTTTAPASLDTTANTMNH
jgi:transposase InsO family protein